MILRRFPEILKSPSFVKISEISDHGARIGRLPRGIGSPGVESGGGGYLGAMGLTPGANSETASDFWGQEQASETYLAPPMSPRRFPGILKFSSSVKISGIPDHGA